MRDGIDYRYPYALYQISRYGDWQTVSHLVDLVFSEKGVHSGGNVILVNRHDNDDYLATYQICRLHYSSLNGRFSLVQKFKGEKL